MRRILLLLAISVVLASCESEMGNFEKVKLNGKDVSGWWACVEDDGDTCYNDVDYVLEIDGSSLTEYFSDGFPIENGYLLGCTMEDWEIGGKCLCSIRDDGDLFIGGFYSGTISVKGDKLYWDEDGYLMVFQKVKGFK